jgi:hypothetical protein
MRTDGQTDLTKLVAACRNFANAPEKVRNVAYSHFLNLEIDVLWLLCLLSVILPAVAVVSVSIDK